MCRDDWGLGRNAPFEIGMRSGVHTQIHPSRHSSIVILETNLVLENSRFASMSAVGRPFVPSDVIQPRSQCMLPSPDV